MSSGSFQPFLDQRGGHRRRSSESVMGQVRCMHPGSADCSIQSLALASPRYNAYSHDVLSTSPHSTTKRTPAWRPDFADGLPCPRTGACWVPSASAPCADHTRHTQIVWAARRQSIPTAKCSGTTQSSHSSPAALRRDHGHGQQRTSPM